MQHSNAENHNLRVEEMKLNSQENEYGNQLMSSKNSVSQEEGSEQNLNIDSAMDAKFSAISEELSYVLPRWENWLAKLSNYLTEWREFNLEEIPPELANSSRTLIHELNSYLELACNNLNDMWILVEWSEFGRHQKNDNLRKVVWDLVYDLYSRCGRIIDCENHPYLEDGDLGLNVYQWANLIIKCRPELDGLLKEEEQTGNGDSEDEFEIKTIDLSGIPQLPGESVFNESVREIEFTTEKLARENSLKKVLQSAKELIDKSPLIKLPSINSQARGALKKTLMQYNF